MIINRTKNTISGTLFGVIQKMITLICPFLIRTIFIRTLGVEYLGLSSLFTSILQVLNLAELGVGSALIFSMYKPIAEDDKDKICALMQLYKKYYRVIGIIILLIGLAVLPFLNNLIQGSVPSDVNIYVLYLMQLMATVLSYWLFAYRNSLFQAHQRIDIMSIINICLSLLTYIAQMVSLLVFCNYYVFLAINIVNQILNNIVTAIISKKMYPLYVPKGKLEKEEIKVINSKVADLFTAKISGVISNSFDTIVVSAFLGLTTLAIYQNYFYIVSAVTGIIMIFFSATQAGIGNFLITKSEKESAQLLNNINYFVFFIVNICCACLINLYQPFMTLWVGKQYLLEYPMVVMFAAYLYAYVLIRPAVVFKDAAGMWKEDKFRPLASSLTNLLLNICTVKFLGLYGVLGSTIVSYLFVSFPWVLLNINKYMFKIDIRKFVKQEFWYTIAILLSCTVSHIMCSLISVRDEVLLIVMFLIISCIVPGVIFLVMFSNSEENMYFMNKIKKMKKLNDAYAKRYKEWSFSGTKCTSFEGYEAVITRFYHTIEKGLAYENYRPGFGKANIDALISAMKNYLSDGYSEEADFYKTALSVLYEYNKKNKEFGLIDQEFVERVKSLPGEKNDLGGIITFEKPVDTQNKNYYELMTERHSIRHFSEQPVDIELLKKAVQLAQYTPSACNRQGWQTRIISRKDVIKRVLENQNGNAGFGHEIDKLLVITSDLRYFNSDRERYQAFIDGGMYAESIINALYYYGMGSIPLSASLTYEQENNIRSLLNIYDSEVLILFVGVGNYCDNNQTTRSERKLIKPIII